MFEAKNAAFRERIEQQLERQEFMKLIGCTLTDIGVAHVRAEIVLGVQHRQQVGITHGGVIATIADVAAGFAGFTLIAADEQLVTVELKTSYFLPATGERLLAVGRVVKHGSSLSFCEADVFSIDKHANTILCARATTTMAIIKERSLDATS